MWHQNSVAGLDRCGRPGPYKGTAPHPAEPGELMLSESSTKISRRIEAKVPNAQR